ncbi:hypothetical protein JXB12_11430 [candidate division KSB1 bacterium]|nr:hypothetical protein [candidate division KSB1 bacterium]
MKDTWTEQIIKELEDLPIVKKKAILELIKDDSKRIPGDKDFNKKWRDELLNTSVWSEEEIEEIYKAASHIFH